MAKNTSKPNPIKAPGRDHAGKFTRPAITDLTAALKKISKLESEVCELLAVREDHLENLVALSEKVKSLEFEIQGRPTMGQFVNVLDELMSAANHMAAVRRLLNVTDPAENWIEEARCVLGTASVYFSEEASRCSIRLAVDAIHHISGDAK